MAFADRHADYGQMWGEGAARCFSIEGDFLDDSQPMRLMPVPDSFFCPISAAIMNDPVATVDGCSYEREYIERWFREKRQFRQPITSPTTGLELQSTTLMPLMALQRAIEAYLLHRPELKRDHLAGRSFEEAASVLQVDLLEKQATCATVHDELHRLREANRALKRALCETEDACKKTMQELEQTRVRVRQLEDDKSLADYENVRAIHESHQGVGSPSGSRRDGGVPGKPPLRPKMEARGANQHFPQAPASKVPEAVPKVESERRRSSARREQTEASKSKGKELGSLWMKQCLQGALLAGLMALCFYLHVRNPGGLKAPLDAEALPWPPGRGSLSLSISRQIDQLQSGTADERVIAAGTLQKLAAEGDENQEAIIKAGVAAVLVKRLEDHSVWVKEASASTLATLASSSTDSQVAVARAGAIPPLVQLLKAGDVNVAPKAAAIALRYLAAGSEKNQVAITRAGAISPLVEMLRSNVPSARLEAAAALRQLAGEGPEGNRYGKQVAIAQAGAIVPLVRLIRDEASRARQAAAGILQILATNNADNQVAIARAGAIGPLVDLLSDAEPGARQEAALALDHLAAFEVDTNFGNQVAIGQAGAIAKLAKLLQDSVPDVAFAAAGALRSLAAGNADNLERVVQAGTIPALALLIKQGQVALSGISLLRSLVSSSSSSQAAAAHTGAIPTLVQLLQDDAPQIRGEAAGTLASLARGNADIQAMIQQAGVSSELLKGDRL